MGIYATVKEQKIKVGDNVELTTTYVDGGKEKKQKFEGMVIALKNAGVNRSFTVRKICTLGIGVERIFPMLWPLLDSVKVIKHNKVRRAKLYYVRGRIGKQASEV